MFKMKVNATAAAVALALSGAAQASLPVQVEVFMSGASAPSNMYRENVVQFACDSSKQINVYVDAIDQQPGGGNPALVDPILQHHAYWVVQCTANASMGSASGKTIAFYKTDPGGSGNGTTPILKRLPVNFMDANPANCTLNTTGQAAGNGPRTYDLYTCPSAPLVGQVPDFGVADVEASKFKGELAPASGDFINDGSVEEKVGPGLIFGVVVTKAMRDEMAADQIAAGLLPSSCATSGQETEACMPSIPSSVARSITTGKYNNWSDINMFGQTLNVPGAWAGIAKSNNVHICRRVKGSGTHAEYMMHYQRTNCYVNSLPILTQPGPGAGFTGVGALVYENGGAGDLGSCLNALDTGTAYSANITPTIAAGTQSFAMGYQSTEKNFDLAKNYRFVKIDGVAPTMQNAVSGTYRQVYYEGLQNELNGYSAGPLRATINATKNADIKAMFDNAILGINSSVVATLNTGFVHPWGQGGFVVPTHGASATYTAGVPQTPWTRENAAGNADSCQGLYAK